MAQWIGRDLHRKPSGAGVTSKALQATRRERAKASLAGSCAAVGDIDGTSSSRIISAVVQIAKEIKSDEAGKHKVKLSYCSEANGGSRIRCSLRTVASILRYDKDKRSGSTVAKLRSTPRGDITAEAEDSVLLRFVFEQSKFGVKLAST